MQVSLNKFYNKNKKRTSTRNKDANNNAKNINLEKQMEQTITKEKAEQILRDFDLDPKYGPCKGLSRMKRFENAVRLHLEPSSEIKNLIENFGLNTSYYDTFI